MSFLAALTLRERLLLLGGGGVVLLLGLWLYVWQPVMAERALQADRIARYLSLINIADNAALTSAVSPRPVRSTPLAPRITQSAETAGIAVARLDPDGPRLRVTVAKASFTDLVAWIAALEADTGVRALSVEMSRLTEPGQVSLRLTLEDAG